MRHNVYDSFLSRIPKQGFSVHDTHPLFIPEYVSNAIIFFSGHMVVVNVEG